MGNEEVEGEVDELLIEGRLEVGLRRRVNGEEGRVCISVDSRHAVAC